MHRSKASIVWCTEMSGKPKLDTRSMLGDRLIACRESHDPPIFSDPARLPRRNRVQGLAPLCTQYLPNVTGSRGSLSYTAEVSVSLAASKKRRRTCQFYRRSFVI